MVVGHNPTIGYLAQMLDDGDGDPDAFAALVEGYPPGSLSVFGVDVPWAELTPETVTGRLLGFWPGASRPTRRRAQPSGGDGVVNPASSVGRLDLLAADAEQVHDRVEVGHVDRRVGRLAAPPAWR